MAELLFYEKPGCVGNQQHKALLRQYGIQFEVRDILRESWTADTLRPFFGDRPVAEWFNDSAPRVKSGEIPIGQLNEDQALAMMIEEPILIRRPLLQFQLLKQSGFTAGAVLDALGVRLDGVGDLQTCPMDEQPCEIPS